MTERGRFEWAEDAAEIMVMTVLNLFGFAILSVFAMRDRARRRGR
jgi:hypothetical protein